MAYFDIETALDALETYMKANLNTKLAAINTRKGDSILTAINDDAYVKQFVDDIPNFDPFLVFGVLDPEITDNVYVDIAQNYTVDVIIFFSKTNDTTSDYKKAFRYQRALKELVCEAFNDIFRQSKFSVKGLTPVTVQITNDSHQHRASGVSLDITLT